MPATVKPAPIPTVTAMRELPLSEVRKLVNRLDADIKAHSAPGVGLLRTAKQAATVLTEKIYGVEVPFAVGIYSLGEPDDSTSFYRVERIECSRFHRVAKLKASRARTFTGPYMWKPVTPDDAAEVIADIATDPKASARYARVTCPVQL